MSKVSMILKGLRKLFHSAEFSMENSQTLKVNL